MSRIPMDVQPVGRNVELINVYFNAQAVTDANVLLSASFVSKATLAKYKELYLKIKNSLRDSTNIAAVTNVRFYENPATGTAGSGYSLIATDASGAIQLFSKADSKALIGGIIDLKVGLQCNTAPTQGSITVELYGIPN